MPSNLRTHPLSYSIPSTPPLNRACMAYRNFDSKARQTEGNSVPFAWKISARWHRAVLFSLTLISAWLGGSGLYYILTENDTTAWLGLIVTLFTLLFGWISFNFWIAVFGFFVLLGQRDRWSADFSANPKKSRIDENIKTCLVVPVYNEDPALVFASLRAVYLSLAREGGQGHFDFFVLSDTTDPDQWLMEEAAWQTLSRELKGPYRIFYRHRRNRIQKKSGNIADFCRRWGRNYKYMIVLDADSLVSGKLAVQMVQIMERHPDIGILQTIPKSVHQKSLIARIHQFASHVYGPVFMAGFYFWQLGDAGFWGHNAIVRLEPFMKCCALPKLRGSPPFGGEILSHDFVEAALLRRAGFGVWIAFDLEGSYEQPPPHLLAELGRDRRWCQGNMQHLRFLWMRGLSSGHRILFLIGNFFYFSSFFWLLFLLSITLNVWTSHFQKTNYFLSERSLFPHWPVYHDAQSAGLLLATAVFLLTPKILGVAALVCQKQTKRFGGFFKIIFSVFFETLSSMLLAPIRMLFHSSFVFLSLLGRKIDWIASPRVERSTRFREALKIHGSGTLLALVWGGALFFINKTFFWWSSVFLIPLGLSIPVSMGSSRADAGMAFKKWGLFLVPEEIRPPQELVDLQYGFERLTKDLQKYGFERAAADPELNALHRSLLKNKAIKNILPGITEHRRALLEKALRQGRSSLSDKEKITLLYDAASMAELHQSVRALPAEAESPHVSFVTECLNGV